MGLRFAVLDAGTNPAQARRRRLTMSMKAVLFAFLSASVVACAGPATEVEEETADVSESGLSAAKLAGHYVSNAKSFASDDPAILDLEGGKFRLVYAVIGGD